MASISESFLGSSWQKEGKALEGCLIIGCTQTSPLWGITLQVLYPTPQWVAVTIGWDEQNQQILLHPRTISDVLKVPNVRCGLHVQLLHQLLHLGCRNPPARKFSCRVLTHTLHRIRQPKTWLSCNWISQKMPRGWLETSPSQPNYWYLARTFGSPFGRGSNVPSLHRESSATAGPPKWHRLWGWPSLAVTGRCTALVAVVKNLCGVSLEWGYPKICINGCVLFQGRAYSNGSIWEYPYFRKALCIQPWFWTKRQLGHHLQIYWDHRQSMISRWDWNDQDDDRWYNAWK